MQGQGERGPRRIGALDNAGCVWYYIAQIFKVIAPKLRHTGTRKPIETSRVYTLTINDGEMTVCKKFYLHTLSVAETVIKKLEEELSVC